MRILVDEGPGRVHELIALGAVFDREATGLLALAREGGHSTARGRARRRRGHRGRGRAGARRRHLPLGQRGARGLVRPRPARRGRAVRRGARAAARARAATRSRCGPTTSCWPPAAPASSSRSPPTRPRPPATAWPWRCGPGVPVADVEFVQFHPTALHHPAMPRPLLSEALRGHGALLRDRDGERFVDELAPRDVVSRAMAARMADAGRGPPVARRHRPRALLRSGSRPSPPRCPSIGLDPEHDWLPIAPAAHYLSGGVVTDLWGATALPGCGRWARWPAPACTGPTGWPPTRCSRAWSSGPGWPSASRRAWRARAERRAAGRARRGADRRDRVHGAGRAPAAAVRARRADRLPGGRTSPSCATRCSGP